jgi:hypothetical protein
MKNNNNNNSNNVLTKFILCILITTPVLCEFLPLLFHKLLFFLKMGYLSDLVNHFKEDEFINNAIENIKNKNLDIEKDIEVSRKKVSMVEVENEALENIINKKKSFINNNIYTIAIIVAIVGVIYIAYPSMNIDLPELVKLIKYSKNIANDSSKYEELSKKIDKFGRIR